MLKMKKTLITLICLTLIYSCQENENSLTSYDGRQYNFNNNSSPIDITNECLNLISNMTMGSSEYSNFLNPFKSKDN